MHRTVLRIRKVGTSAGVVLPKDLLERLGLKVGDALVVRPSKNGFELSPSSEDSLRRARAFERSRRKFTNAYRELGGKAVGGHPPRRQGRE